jgi:hypothetical protein
MIRNKHKWGNNISNRDKIMVNLPKGLFNITRHGQKLGSKIIIFGAIKII